MISHKVRLSSDSDDHRISKLALPITSTSTFNTPASHPASIPIPILLTLYLPSSNIILPPDKPYSDSTDKIRNHIAFSYPSSYLDGDHVLVRWAHLLPSRLYLRLYLHLHLHPRKLHPNCFGDLAGWPVSGLGTNVGIRRRKNGEGEEREKKNREKGRGKVLVSAVQYLVKLLEEGIDGGFAILWANLID